MDVGVVHLHQGGPDGGHAAADQRGQRHQRRVQLRGSGGRAGCLEPVSAFACPVIRAPHSSPRRRVARMTRVRVRVQRSKRSSCALLAGQGNPQGSGWGLAAEGKRSGGEEPSRDACFMGRHTPLDVKYLSPGHIYACMHDMGCGQGVSASETGDGEWNGQAASASSHMEFLSLAGASQGRVSLIAEPESAVIRVSGHGKQTGCSQLSAALNRRTGDRLAKSITIIVTPPSTSLPPGMCVLRCGGTANSVAYQQHVAPVKLQSWCQSAYTCCAVMLSLNQGQTFRFRNWLFCFSKEREPHRGKLSRPHKFQSLTMHMVLW